MSDNLFFNIADLKSIGKNVIIGKTVRIRQPELVEIGDNVIIDDFTYISGNISIGNYVHIASGCNFQSADKKIVIGNHCGFASGVKVFAVSSDFLHPDFDMPCYPPEIRRGGIKNDISFSDFCLIGANTVIQPGVILPEGVAISANALVSPRNFEPWFLYFGQNLEKKLPRSSKNIENFSL
jgi:galactoside O-acetyltransferase